MPTCGKISFELSTNPTPNSARKVIQFVELSFFRPAFWFRCSLPTGLRFIAHHLLFSLEAPAHYIMEFHSKLEVNFWVSRPRRWLQSAVIVIAYLLTISVVLPNLHLFQAEKAAEKEKSKSKQWSEKFDVIEPVFVGQKLVSLFSRVSLAIHVHFVNVSASSSRPGRIKLFNDFFFIVCHLRLSLFVLCYSTVLIMFGDDDIEMVLLLFCPRFLWAFSQPNDFQLSANVNLPKLPDMKRQQLGKYPHKWPSALTHFARYKWFCKTPWNASIWNPEYESFCWLRLSKLFSWQSGPKPIYIHLW